MAIYLDYAASTPIDGEVLEHMVEGYKLVGNCSSPHAQGQVSKKYLENSRNEIGELLGLNGEGIYFTSGASESNNMIIKGICLYHQNEKKHLITTTIEHPSVKSCFKYLETIGYQVTYLKPNLQGCILEEDLINALTNNTLLVSIIWVNNETGMIQPVERLAEIAHAKGAYFHTDGVQALGKVKIDLNNTKMDSISFSGHKIYGPKGLGIAYIRKGILMEPLIHGGGQERGRRSGTENLPAIMAMSKAVALSQQYDSTYFKRLGTHFIELLNQSEIAYTLNHGLDDHCDAIWNVSFEGCLAEALLIRLNLDQIYVSNGAACSSGSTILSETLSSAGLSVEKVRSSLRFSFGKSTTEAEIVKVVDQLKKHCHLMRQLNIPF